MQLKKQETLNAYGLGRSRRTGLRLDAQGRRNAGILAVRKAHPTMDLTQCAIFYDFEHAPMTTNAAQLSEIGVQCWQDESIEEVKETIESLSSAGVRKALVEVIEGLADLGIFLIDTDHLTDAELLTLLTTQVLREPVRDLPPSQGVTEFVTFEAHRGASPFCARRDAHLPRRSQS